MLELNVDIVDRVSTRLTEFGTRADSMLVGVSRKLGNAFRTFVRRNYLSGQMLARRSGRTKSGMRVSRRRRSNDIKVVPYMALANIYHHAGGATILPKNASILRWVGKDGQVHFAHRIHLHERPFMTTAFQAFAWGSETDKAADKVIEKEIQKRLGNG